MFNRVRRISGLPVGGVYIINISLVFPGGANMNQDKNFFVTIVAGNRSIIITRMGEIRSSVRGVCKICAAFIVGFCLFRDDFRG